MARAAAGILDRQPLRSPASDPRRRSLATMSSEPRLSCRKLWKVYGTDAVAGLRAAEGSAAGDVIATIASLRDRGCVPAACDVSFDVRPGEILIDGQDILALSDSALIDLRRHRMGMVFQNFGLMPHMTVLENVAYPLRVQGLARMERTGRAMETIELVGLRGREASYPRELSGGMQQRVGIARSLAVNPEIWFLDEPFSALDPLIRRQMQDEFLRLQSVLKKSIVFITHDFLEAIRLADRVAIMRDGCIVQIGTAAQLVLEPADSYVAEFTREVPRGKIVTARDILEPAGGPIDPEGGVGEGETLEVLLQLFAGRRQPIPVVSESGAVIGQVSLDRALSALSPDRGR